MYFWAFPYGCIASKHQLPGYKGLSKRKETVNYTLPPSSSSSWRFFWADYELAVFALSTCTQLPYLEELERNHAEERTL